MTKKGVALFTMDQLDEPVAEMIEHVADHGYDGVQFVNRMHPDIDVESVAAAMDRTGLESAGVHVWLHKLEDDLEPLVEKYGKLGCDTFVIPYHPDSPFRTVRRVRQLVDRLNQVAARVDDHGWNLLYHPNHWDYVPVYEDAILGRLPSLRPTDYLSRDTDPIRTADEETFDGDLVDPFRKVEGAMLGRRNIVLDWWYVRSGVLDDNSVETFLTETPMKYILSETDPDTFGLEIDASFVTQQGFDPVAVIDRISDRIGSVHIKDVRTDEYTVAGWPSFVDPGEGVVDFEGVARSVHENDIEWMLVENGHSERPLETIQRGMDLIGPVGARVEP
jgi:sugar phosphate isomerase/epimerase